MNTELHYLAAWANGTMSHFFNYDDIFPNKANILNILSPGRIFIFNVSA